MTSPFLDALHAEGPATDRAGKMALYGQFVGSWDLDVTEFRADGTTNARAGEWHFDWALEGRAVQDVWIVPPRGQRTGDAVALSNRYGTTLRVYDPRIDAWQIQWTEPVGQTYLSMVGRQQGNDIVQLGKSSADSLLRWSFSKITPTSFLWRGEASEDEGATWKQVVEFTARRVM